ncbi:hypothetical protein XENOCAPTIV_008135 [Xenoophorus captivus]|uniref:Uncharacterized protein n=1 Tax=Xenoophorus captivus TaxID=1517983 RepID=A0ABV0Q8Q4_9TELE
MSTRPKRGQVPECDIEKSHDSGDQQGAVSGYNDGQGNVAELTRVLQSLMQQQAERDAKLEQEYKRHRTDGDTSDISLLNFNSRCSRGPISSHRKSQYLHQQGGDLILNHLTVHKIQAGLALIRFFDLVEHGIHLWPGHKNVIADFLFRDSEE